MGNNDFAAWHTDLCAGEPAAGSVGLLPWDSQVFGFPVGEYRAGSCGWATVHAGRVHDALLRWAEQNQVEVCTASIPAAQHDWIALLPEWGFRFIDFTLRMALPGLQRATLPESRITLRPAEPADAPATAAIAQRAFRFGRYFADARFPEFLAAKRFYEWVANAIQGAGPGACVYILEDRGHIDGFSHVTIDRDTADLSLPALDLHLQKSLLGYELYLATLRLLKDRGVNQVTGKISCANTGVTNICAMLGFRFSEPEAVFHWHSPAARHLHPPPHRQSASGNTVERAL